VLKAVNDYEQSAERFMQYGAKVLRPQDLENYKLTEDQVTRILHAPSLADEMIAEMSLGDEVLGQTLPWSKTYSLFRIRKAEMTVWSGYNGHGKSLMLSQVLLGMMQQGERVMVFSGEMTPERQLKRMVKQAAGLDRPSIPYIDAIGAWITDKLWFFNVVGSAGIDRLLQVFLYASKRYGMSHFVIDSLMMTDVPEDGPGSMTAQKDAVRKLCDFVRRNGCHLHLVAHPRKGADENRGPGKLDVAGSSKITDGADNVFTVWSARKDESDADADPEKPDARLELQKQRNGDVQHYSLPLWFCRDAQQFSTNSRRRSISYVDFKKQEEAA